MDGEQNRQKTLILVQKRSYKTLGKKLGCSSLCGDSGFSTGGAGFWTMLSILSKTCSRSRVVWATPPQSYKRITPHGLRHSRVEISTLRCGTPTKAFNS